jgi:hypothetical protein
VTCKSRNTTFNTDVKQQWEQNQHEILEEEFVSTVNFFHELQEPEHNQDWDNTNSGYHQIIEDYTEADDTSEDKDGPEYDLDDLLHFSNDRMTYQTKRKSICLCRHKLQGRTECRSRSWRQPPRQHRQNWPMESETNQQIEIDLVDEDADTEGPNYEKWKSF